MKFANGPKFIDPRTGTEWANEHTFQVAHWMLNDSEIYSKMTRFMRTFEGPIPYRSWINEMGLSDDSTPNGWRLVADAINYGELSQIMRATQL